MPDAAVVGWRPWPYLLSSAVLVTSAGVEAATSQGSARARMMKSAGTAISSKSTPDLVQGRRRGRRRPRPQPTIVHAPKRSDRGGGVCAPRVARAVAQAFGIHTSPGPVIGAASRRIALSTATTATQISRSGHRARSAGSAPRRYRRFLIVGHGRPLLISSRRNGVESIGR